MLFWLALALWIVLSVAGLAFATVRGIVLWRAAKRTGAAISGEVAGIAERAERIQGHLDRAEAAGGRLKLATDRLARSRATLDVLIGAIREARAALGVAAPFSPPPRR